MALNLFNIIKDPFTNDSTIDYELLYEISYMQQRYADILVDLELEHIQRIIDKIISDPEPESVKRVELDLWKSVYATAKAGRRTGCGFTGLGDMLAALNLKYDSNEALKVIEKVCKTKMEAELDCTIDLSILRGSFEGWKSEKEFLFENIPYNGNIEDKYRERSDWYNFASDYTLTGLSSFYQMLVNEFRNKVLIMNTYGRRNISWSTCAPTGSVSILTATSSGIEPLFSAYYIRRKKINSSDKSNRIDFTDANGDNWQEFPVLHPKFKYWIDNIYNKKSRVLIIDLSKDSQTSWIYDKENLELAFKESPWYQSTANDISWEKRVEIQSVIQKYTTNAISSTINLPNNVKKEEVANIYTKAWELGLKGVTCYRDGCRTGVLVNTETKEVTFSQKDALKRPKLLQAEGHIVKVKGEEYIVLVGLIDEHPYEVFASKNQWELPKNFTCTITKNGKTKYTIDVKDSLQIESFTSEITDEEAAITRLISTSLRHGTDCKYIVEQLNKTHGSMVTLSKAIARVLGKYIAVAVTKENCPECGEKLIMEEGCKHCNSCGYSAC